MKILPLNRLKTYTLRLAIFILAFQMSDAQGPNAPEAASFEPVDATDMVNLVTGDMSYVLPLLNVPSPEGGYPIALSYHAGIGMDQEASWVGLGWNINPGAINRSVNGEPDDWRHGKQFNFIYSDLGEEEEITIGIGASYLIFNAAIDYTFINGKGSGGTVEFGIASNQDPNSGIKVGVSVGYGGKSGVSFNASVNNISVGMSTNGNISLGVQTDFLQNTISFNNKNGLSFSQGGNPLGISLSSNSVGFSLGNFGISAIASNHITASGVSINRKGFAGAIPISKFFHVKFSYFKTTAHIFDSEINTVYGSLYSKYGSYAYSNNLQSVETRYMDILESYMKGTHLPTGIDYSANFKVLNYDDYNVSGQGVLRKIQPFVYEYGYLTGKKGYDRGSYVYIDEPFSKEFGNTDNNIYFHSTVSDDSFLRVDNSSWNIPQNISNITDITSSEILNYNFNNELGYDNTSKRRRTGTYIETYTNSQINSNPNLIYEANNFNRSHYQANGHVSSTYPRHGIGAFKVTTLDGKTYHYSLPVYQYEDFTRGFDQIRGEDKSFSEIQRVTPFATHWLLTAITGPDYLDNNSDGKINESDYGYWVTFDYGKWTNSFMWDREAKESQIQRGRVSVFADKKKNIVKNWGLRQLYYLNAINTRTHSALFMKSIRDDNKGASLTKSWTYNDVNKGILTDDASLAIGLYFQNNKYTYNVRVTPTSSLKLDKIVLVKRENLNNFSLTHSLLPNINQTSNNIDLKVSGDTHNILGQPVGRTNKTLHERTWLAGNYGNNVYLSDNFNQSIIDQYVLSSTVFEHSYDLSKEANSAKGKLTLNKVWDNGKNNRTLIPPYQFSYYNGAAYNENNFDLWGYCKSYPENWSLKKIKSPTGNELVINYERDDFKTVLLEKNSKTHSQMTPHAKTFERLNNGYKGKFELIHTNPCYEIGEVYSCLVVNNSIDIRFTKTGYTSTTISATITNVNQNHLQVDFSTQVPSHFSGDFYNSSTRTSSPGYMVYFQNLDDCESIQGIGKCNDSRGGIRVSKITNFYDGNVNSTFYEYANPVTGESSGITAQTPYISFANLKNLVPGAGVMYEFVTVSTKNNNNQYLSKEVYNFNTLSPLNYNVSTGSGRFWATNVIDQVGNYLKIEYEKEIINTNIINSTSDKDRIELLDLKVYNNYALLGTLKSRKEYNSNNQLINSLQYDYGTDFFTNKLGTTSESFKSYTMYRGRGPRRTTQDTYNLTKSNIIKNNSLIESTTTTQGGFTSTTNFLKHDFLTGQVLETTTTDSKGNRFKTELIPAYTFPEYGSGAYSMGSKVDNITNKNMLTQNAMTKTYMDVAGDWKETSVGITTWNNKWRYVNFNGTTNSPTDADQQQIWRKHKSFVWDGGLNDDGTLQGFTNSTPEDDDENFVWTVGPEIAQTNADWKNVSTTTQYDHYSMPLEVRDINGNYASTKMGDANSKVFMSANAKYGECFYTGAEDPLVSNFIGQQIKLVNGASRVSTYAHTGTQSIQIAPGNSIHVDFISGKYRSGNYKVSVWVKKDNAANVRVGFGSASEPFNGEQITAGDWVQLNHYMDLNGSSGYINITSNNGNIYADDLRVHPIASSMTSYVYNEWDELWYIIGANGLASKFEYDVAGRLLKTYSEVIDFNGAGTGGFKQISENNYHYKN